MNKAPCAVVCVTQQASCKRLIDAGKKISDEHGLRLEVLNVQPVKDCYAPDPGAMELLHEACRGAGARMSVYFSDNPAILTASFLKKMNASVVIMGFPKDITSPFIASVRMLLPDLPITMVDEDANMYHMTTGEIPSRVTQPERV